METIKSFEDMVIHLAQRNDRKRVAVVWAADRNSQVSVARALEIGFIEAIFVGCQAEVEANESIMRYASHVSFIPADDRDEAARISVKLVRDGGADILMKGLINTDNLLRAILNKDTGILRPGRVLTHVAMAEIPKYEKLLFFTDAAVIPVPTKEQRRQQVMYMTYVCHALGIEEPRISLIHCAEKVSEKTFPYPKDYLDIIAEAQTGKYGRCIIDGPLDLKTSLDSVSLREKGIHSVIDGQADALIFPDIVAGNVFYKTLTLFAYAKTAGVLQGTTCPCVVSSRADSPESKYYSLALAAI